MSIAMVKLRLLQKSIGDKIKYSDTFDEAVSYSEKELYDTLSQIMPTPDRYY